MYNSSDDAFAAYDTYRQVAANQEIATQLMAPTFIGLLLHMFLFGIVVTRTFEYASSKLYQADSSGQKVLLWSVVGLDFVSTGVGFAQAVHYGTQQNRSTNVLLMGVTGLDAPPGVLCGTVALLVQLALAERAAKLFLWRRTLRFAFLVAIWVLSFAAWLSSVGITTLYALFAAGNTNPIIETPFTWNVTIGVWVFLSAGVDLCITISLVLVLRSEKRGLDLDTDFVVQQIMRLAVETGATTSVTALCCALLAVSFSKNDIGMSNVPFAFSFPLPSLYALTLLVTLNARGANLERRRQIGSTRRLSESTVGDTAPPLWISRETTVNVEMMDLWGGSAGKTSQESVGGASPVLGRPAKVKFASIRGRHHTRALPV